VGAVPALQPARVTLRTAFELIGLIVSVGLVVYLVIALLYPERFQ
jgi:K+-transporting ATPase KdpF subunit